MKRAPPPATARAPLRDRRTNAESHRSNHHLTHRRERIMLVKFDSKVGGVTMFGDVAVKLLKMMGHSGTVPSALLAKDIPGALAQLKAALAITQDDRGAPAKDQDGGESRVSLRQRAYPLIELMERAAARGVDITWNY